MYMYFTVQGHRVILQEQALFGTEGKKRVFENFIYILSVQLYFFTFEKIHGEDMG